jgi:transposase
MINVEVLQTACKVIKVSVVARMAGIAPGTLDSKIRFNRELTVTESSKIEKVLHELGITLQTTRTDA